MFTKIKQWILGKVIGKKVVGKLVKHATGALVGLIFGSKVAPYVQPVFEAMELTQGELEAGLIVALTGLFGAAWNYVEHRFIKPS